MPQLSNSAAQICRGCQFHRLPSSSRQAGDWCLGWLCLQCLQGLRRLLGQQEKELQDHCTEMLVFPLDCDQEAVCSPTLCVGGREMKIQKGERLGQSHIARKRGSWTRGERDWQMLGMMRVHGACGNSFAGACQRPVLEYPWMSGSG